VRASIPLSAAGKAARSATRVASVTGASHQFQNRTLTLATVSSKKEPVNPLG
jgi:hypothetical protein